METSGVILWSVLAFFALAHVFTVYIWKLPGSNWARQWIEPGFIALLIAVIIRIFLLQGYRIPSQSMENTLIIGDQILETKFSYSVTLPWDDRAYIKTASPKRGDVIIFKYPEDTRILFVKRCMGLPGDVIEIRKKALFVNGAEVKEAYAVHKDPEIFPEDDNVRDNFGPVQVPPGEFFVMGDNRDYSLDSRFWGYVPFSLIKGRAWLIYWPPKRWGIIR
jgi:signal peptidase I